MKTVGNFIDGQVCLSSSNQTVDVHNPASGRMLSELLASDSTSQYFLGCSSVLSLICIVTFLVEKTLKRRKEEEADMDARTPNKKICGSVALRLRRGKDSPRITAFYTKILWIFFQICVGLSIKFDR